MKQILQGTHGTFLTPSSSLRNAHPGNNRKKKGHDDERPADSPPPHAESEPNPEQIYQLVTGMIEEDLLYLLAVNLHRLPFESRKDTQVILSYVFRFRPPTGPQMPEPLALAYVVERRPQVLLELCRGYNHKESATPAGTVLREVLKNQAAAAIILYDDGDEPGSSARAGLAGIDPDRPQSGKGVFWMFFDWIDKSSFEVSADAFTTFRVSPESESRIRAKGRKKKEKKRADEASAAGTAHAAQGRGAQVPVGQL